MESHLFQSNLIWQHISAHFSFRIVLKPFFFFKLQITNCNFKTAKRKKEPPDSFFKWLNENFNGNVESQHLNWCKKIKNQKLWKLISSILVKKIMWICEQNKEFMWIIDWQSTTVWHSEIAPNKCIGYVGKRKINNSFEKEKWTNKWTDNCLNLYQIGHCVLFDEIFTIKIKSREIWTFLQSQSLMINELKGMIHLINFEH